MRSVLGMAVVTAVFAGTLVGGLHHTGALDPEMLRGPKEDHPGAARAGWKTHHVPQAGFSIQLPPDWRGAPANGKVVFRALDGKKAHATLTVTAASTRGQVRADTPTTKHFRRGAHTLTFTTTPRLAAFYARVFQTAADSFRAQR